MTTAPNLELVRELRALAPPNPVTLSSAEMELAQRLLHALAGKALPNHRNATDLAFFQRPELQRLVSAVAQFELTWRAMESAHGLIAAVAANADEITGWHKGNAEHRGNALFNCAMGVASIGDAERPEYAEKWASAFYRSAEVYRQYLLSPRVVGRAADPRQPVPGGSREQRREETASPR